MCVADSQLMLVNKLESNRGFLDVSSLRYGLAVFLVSHFHPLDRRHVDNRCQSHSQPRNNDTLTQPPAYHLQIRTNEKGGQFVD